MNQWSLFIDVEGFSHIGRKGQKQKPLSGKSLRLLADLAYDLYKIGTRIYPENHHRLFIHQVGDGFVVCPDIGNLDLVRPISIAIALMRSTALRDGTTRVAISVGEMADIQSCYPTEMQDSIKDGCLNLGSGIMTIFPVMGNALANAHKLLTLPPKGPRLLLDRDLESEAKSIGVHILGECSSHIEIDWIHSEVILAGKILAVINSATASAKIIEGKLRTYIKENSGLSSEWKNGAHRLIDGMPH